ncbi:hypothetical protein Tco_0934661 [Tanacetum coccineum]
MLALNPSPPFGLLFISPFMGISGLSVCAGKGVIRAGRNWLVIWASKSSQSLSIAHKWAVVITDVENAIFDLGVVDPLCLLFID